MTEELNMDTLMAQSEDAKTGAIVEGTVVGETKTHLVMNVGSKQDALLPLHEVSHEIPAIGSKLPVLILKMQGPEGHPIVSWKQARELKNWDAIIAHFESGQPVEGKIIKRVKGGVSVDIGLEAFMPASQMDKRPVPKPEDWIGKTIRVKILEMDRVKRNVLVSRRKLLDEEKAAKRDKTLQTLKEGEILDGVVTGLTGFGAFVDIGGIEGLLHMSDMDWVRVESPKKIVKVGDKLQVKVLKYDPTTHKISLGRKQLLPHPWDGLAKRLPVGSVVQGKVTGLAAFGAFVQVEPAVEGLIHISELSWTDRVKNPKDLLKVGQTVEVKVVAIDRPQEKLSLSLKRMGENPWEVLAKKYPVGTPVEGTISHLTAFGAFVKLSEGLEALIKTADISWTDRIQHPNQVFKIGDPVKAKVLEIDTANEKMALGVKQLTGDPMKVLKIGTSVTGTVVKLTDGGLILKLQSGLEGYVRNSELKPRKSIFADLSHHDSLEAKDDRPKEGEVLTGSVVKINKKERKLELSIRRYEQNQEKELLRKYSGANQKMTLGDATGWNEQADEEADS